MWALGMLSFWTTRVGALFELYFTAELIFSGRLVPLSLLPDWAQQVANVLPFQWAFGYPIEVLIGQRDLTQSLIGLCVQAFWILLGIAVVALVWRLALKHYTAVGN
ncbi:MAG: ABC-2 family transporter protein [Anaerolineae bacterium]